MADERTGGPPQWLLTIVMACGFVACGLYLGMMRVQGASTGDLIRSVGYGMLALVMLWALMARR